ncbi:MAG: SDR family oxidoreductase [Bryobacterales bacterium]|nr:SDR family oxidoreductase [Bryobacterales bacterium]
MHPDIAAMFDLSGKTAVVTGGARHLGWDAAATLAKAGCAVAVTSRDGARAADSAARLGELFGVDTMGLALDQRDGQQVAAVAGQIFAWRPRVDVLVNNAGGAAGDRPGILFERTGEDAAALIETNLTGMVHCCRVFGERMAAEGSGKIINIASMAGMMGRDRRMYARAGMKGQPVEYAAAKAGVIGLTRDLAGFLSPMGVCVNAISPGGFERGQPEQFVRDYSDRTPMGRMGRDGVDLNGAVLFLACAASDYVTGHNLVVDGGFSIWH